eukprot:464187-Rhodomonas_salina.1
MTSASDTGSSCGEGRDGTTRAEMDSCRVSESARPWLALSDKCTTLASPLSRSRKKRSWQQHALCQARAPQSTSVGEIQTQAAVLIEKTGHELALGFAEKRARDLEQRSNASANHRGPFASSGNSIPD